MFDGESQRALHARARVNLQALLGRCRAWRRDAGVLPSG